MNDNSIDELEDAAYMAADGVMACNDESDQPEYALEMDETDLAWDLPDSGDEPELNSEENAAWEAGTLALLHASRMTFAEDAIDAETADESEESYPDDSYYPDDEMPDPVGDIYTENLPAIDAMIDIRIVNLMNESLATWGPLGDTDVIPVADGDDAWDSSGTNADGFRIMDDRVGSDTDVIQIVDDAVNMDTDVIEIIDEGIVPDTDIIPIINAEDLAETDALEMPLTNDMPGETAITDSAGTSGGQGRRNRTALDYAIWVAGTAAAVLAVVAGVKYYNVLHVRAEAGQYQMLGSALAGIGTIGEDQITAIHAQRIRKDTDRKEAERKAAEKAALAANEGTIPVTMALSTVQSDLKVKIHGEDGSLITGVPFKISVEQPSGKTAEYEDDDQDGIIYQTGLSKGNYEVTMEQLVLDTNDGTDITDTDEYKSYSQYKIPADTQTIAVTDKIAYTAIDVKDEIKSTSQVNVAAEDTQHKLATESEMQDTVEFVASTTTAEEDALYETVDKDEIVDPNVSARADLIVRDFRMLAKEAEDTGVHQEEAAVISEESDDQENADQSSDDKEDGDNDDNSSDVDQSKHAYTTTIKGSTTVASGRTTLITASTDEPGATTYTWTLDGDAISIDRTDGKTVTVTGNHEGTATLTATAHLVAEDADPAENVVSTTITVTAAEETSDKRLTVSPTSATLAPGKTQSLSVTLEGLDDDGVSYDSADVLIAEVSDDGTITAKAAGETTVTVTANADSSLKQSVKVKVVETETNADGNTLLKDKNGNQIYVKDNGGYREATAADYDAFDTFYRKIEGKAAASGFKYTGWQNIGGKTYYFNSAGEPVTGNQVINGASYTFGDDGALVSGTSKVGIDVSQWNGSISWNSVAGSGISYAIIRCGYRGSSTGALIKDPNYATNMAGAAAAGLKVGIYVFSQAVNEVEAVEEASMAISLASGYRVSMPIFIDVEAAGGRADGLSTSQRTAVVSAFCQTVQAAGYSAGIYSNTNWLTERVNTPALTSYHIWVAQYASSLAYSRTRYDIWQYSSKGRVAGISGDVDMNMSYRSY